MMNTSTMQLRNRVLSKIPPTEMQRILPHLETVTLKLDELYSKPANRSASCTFLSDVLFQPSRSWRMAAPSR